MKSTIQDNANITGNSKQLAILKSNFPECFDKNGVFIASKLQEIVQASGVEVSKESYGINWLGKSYARLLANQNPQTLLKANTAHNELPENANSQNMLIKGDNLEVLKHLVGAYRGEVKMIYIDPPYNTGSDGFVYQDDRKFTVAQLSHLAGIDETEAKRILEFTQSKSNSHSAWLTFMYPRLYIAKQLLKDDGVIFIQIDDNEQAQLKILCDEIFGEENFISEICVKMSHLSGVKMAHKEKKIPKIKEFILMYSKGVSQIKLNPIYVEGKWENVLDRYDYIVDKKGTNCTKWIVSNLNAHLKKNNILNDKDIYDFKISHADSIFRTATAPALNGVDKNTYFEDFENSSGIKKYIYKGEEVLFASTKIKNIDGKNVPADLIGDIWTDIGINNLHNEGDVYFSNGKKPLKLISRIINIIINNAVSENETVLDFFAGSGTTAHAVMQLNSTDGGNRRFICVQIDEPTDAKSDDSKAGYKTIYDITAARIHKAAAKIKVDFPLAAGNFGFKQFETIPVFEGYLDEPEELTPNLELFDVTKLSQEDRHNLMLTWQVQDNIPLTQSLTVVDLAGYKAYQGKHILYFIEPNITLDAVIKLLEQLDNNPSFAPRRVVVLGYLLDSKIQREMTEAIKHYNNRKGIELTLDIRF